MVIAICDYLRHCSWLNMAEIELNVLNSQCRGRLISSAREVTQKAAAWQKHLNNQNNKISWHFTMKDARIKLRKLYPSTHA